MCVSVRTVRIYEIECMCVYLRVGVERVADGHLARRKRDAHHVCTSNEGIITYIHPSIYLSMGLSGSI